MVFPAVSIAQTLQAPDLHPQGYTFTYGVSNQQPNGWDWTNAFSLQDVALEFLPTDSTAYADGFSNADYAQVSNIQGTQYAYYSYDADGMGFWGGVDPSGIQVVHPEEIVTLPFPFTVGDVHQDSLSFVFEAGADQVHRDIHLTSVAAEWGALLLPGKFLLQEQRQLRLPIRVQREAKDENLADLAHDLLPCDVACRQHEAVHPRGRRGGH